MHMMRHQNEHRIFDEKSEYVKYRRILVDWLADIQLKFHLQPHTTHVAVMYMDRIMQSCVVRPSLSLSLTYSLNLTQNRYQESHFRTCRWCVFLSQPSSRRERLMFPRSICSYRNSRHRIFPRIRRRRNEDYENTSYNSRS